MKKHFDDYEKRIWKSLDRETEAILQELAEDPEASAAEPGEDLDRRILAQIHELEGENPAIKALSEEDKEALRLGRELQKRRKEEEAEKTTRKKRLRVKRLASAAAVLVLVAGVGITGVGGPKRIVEMVENTFGGRESSRINASKEEVKTTEDSEEVKVYQQIKDELGFDAVRVVCVSDDMQYEFGEVDGDMQLVHLLYKYGESNISYMISSTYTEELLGTDMEDEVTDIYPFEAEELKAEITEYTLSDTSEKRYQAEFEYQGIYYQLIGTIEKIEFEEILKNLHFPV